MTTIHTCSYYCERPECIKRQRDALVKDMEAREAVDGRYDERAKDAVPDGMVLVPREPTGAMIMAGCQAVYNASMGDFDATPDEAAMTYRAMLAARPVVAAPQGPTDADKRDSERYRWPYCPNCNCTYCAEIGLAKFDADVDTTQEKLPPLPDECYKYERLINAMHEYGLACYRAGAEARKVDKDAQQAVRAATLKEAAKICEAMTKSEYRTGKVDHNELGWTQACAAAIRALGLAKEGTNE